MLKGCNPRVCQVVRSPLLRRSLQPPWETSCGSARPRRQRKAGSRGPGEEVAFFMDVGPTRHTRVGFDKGMPPRGASLLGSDADEVPGGPAPPVAQGWGSEVESGLPQGRTARRHAGRCASHGKAAVRQAGTHTYTHWSCRPGSPLPVAATSPRTRWGSMNGLSGCSGRFLSVGRRAWRGQ